MTSRFPPIEISDAAAQRRKEVVERWKRYDGEHPDSLTPDKADVSDNVTINHCGTIVDTGVDFLFGGSVEFGVTQRTENRDENGKRLAEKNVELAEWLDDIWQANKRDTLFRKIGMAGAIEDTAVLKIVTRQDKPEEFRIILLDSAWVSIKTRKNDIDTVIGYAIDTPELDGYGNVVKVHREQHDQTETGEWEVQWLITEEYTWNAGMLKGQSIRWTPDPERPDPEAWPHRFPALAHCQNLPRPHSVYGVSDLPADVLELNEAINRVASNEQKTIRHFAQPVVHATPGEDGEVKKLQATIDAHIGGVLCLPYGTQLDSLQMQAEGPEAAREFRQALEDKLYERARTPRIAAGKVDNIGAIAGVALLLLYRPLIAKTETKRDTYGDLLAEVNKRLLHLGGKGDYGTLDVPLTWPDPLPKDQLSEAQTVREWGDIGVSKQTRVEKLGLDWEQEQARIAEENEDPMGDERGSTDRMAEMQATIDELRARLAGRSTDDADDEDA